MVSDFYGLEGDPFGATPDSRYLFESNTHREALASLLYGVQAGRGFMALIAKPGMGKTTLLFRALSQLREQGRTVFLFQTMLTPLDLLRTLLADLGVQDLQGGVFELQTKLNEILVGYSRRSERLVVVIDETQNLDDSVLEMVRMLSNFETQEHKLMQIILSGQPQLAQKLRSPNLLQLRQRISIVAHLEAFSPEQTEQYVEHRLRVAGYNSDRSLFTRSAMQLIAKHTEGIPRNINTLCFNALSIGCALKRKTIDADIVREVISDLDLVPLDQVMVVPQETPIEKPASAPAPIRNIPSFAGWAIKAALATAFLLLLTGVPLPSGSHAIVLANVRKLTRSDVKTAVALSGAPVSQPAALPKQGGSPTPAIGSAPPTASGRTRANASGVPTFVSTDVRRLRLDTPERILVPPGVTLYEICRQTMKTCHSSEIEAIRRLNPWLTNPNHLESGRTLHLPLLPQVAAESARSHSDESTGEIPK